MVGFNVLPEDSSTHAWSKVKTEPATFWSEVFPSNSVPAHAAFQFDSVFIHSAHSRFMGALKQINRGHQKAYENAFRMTVLML